MMRTCTFLSAGILCLSLAPVFAQDDDAKKTDVKETIDPSGTWRWEYDWDDTHYKDALRLNMVKDGKVVGHLIHGESVLKVQSATIKHDKLHVTVVTDREGKEWTIQYDATIDGDSLNGTVVLAGDGQSYEFPWEAERSVQMDDLVGTWEIHIDAGDGNTFDPILTVSKKDDDYQTKYVSRRGGELEVSKLRIEDNHLKFTVTADFQGNIMTVNYNGRPYGDQLTGMLDYDFGGNTGELKFTAKRQHEKQDAQKEPAADQ